METGGLMSMEIWGFDCFNGRVFEGSSDSSLAFYHNNNEWINCMMRDLTASVGWTP